MVATLVLEASAERRVGSSPTWGTKLMDRWQSGPMHWIANPENREFKSHSVLQVLGSLPQLQSYSYQENKRILFIMLY